MCSVPDIRPEGYRAQLEQNLSAANSRYSSATGGFLKNSAGLNLNAAKRTLRKLDQIEQQESMIGAGGHSAPDSRTQVGVQQGVTNMRGAPSAVPNDPAKQKKNLIGQ